MKRGRKPTAAQKRLLASWRLNPGDWLVCGNTPTETVIIHRHTETVKRLPKEPAK